MDILTQCIMKLVKPDLLVRKESIWRRMFHRTCPTNAHEYACSYPFKYCKEQIYDNITDAVHPEISDRLK